MMTVPGRRNLDDESLLASADSNQRSSAKRVRGLLLAFVSVLMFSPDALFTRLAEAAHATQKDHLNCF